MTDSKEPKKKSFADIFKNILKETKKDKDPPKKDSKDDPTQKSEVTPDKDSSTKPENSLVLKDALPSNKSEKIIFYEERKNSINDETIFDFVIKGGPNHSDLLVACASYRSSTGRGEPVALTCKWFNVTDNNELREIEGVTGAFYQPCADDIGTRYDR